MPDVLATLKAVSYDYPVAPDNIREESTMRLEGFPTITVTEIQNSDVSSIGGTEKLSTWGCQIDIYAKNMNGVARRAVARRIAQQVDDALKTGMLMRRTTVTTVPYDDETARFVLRFDCQVTDKDYVHRTT